MRIRSAILALIASFSLAIAPVNAQNIVNGGSTKAYVNGARTVVSGSWYWAEIYWSTQAGAVFSITTTYARAVYIPNAITIQAIGAYIQTAAASGNCQFAIYASNANGRPTGSVIAQTANISTTTAGAVSGSITPVALAANTIYFFAAMCDNTTIQFKSVNTVDTYNGYGVGATTLADLNESTTTAVIRFTIGGQTFGTFPTNPTMAETGINGQSASTPAFMFQAS